MTSYKNYEILIVDNKSDDKDTLEYLSSMNSPKIRVEKIGNEGKPFSFSRINNRAVEKINSEYILFLNNDIEVIESKWLSRLTGYLSIPGVGIVGAKLLFPNRTLQHAGVVLGMHEGIIPDHAFINHPANKISYYFMAEVARNCAAVTAACLMSRKSDFLQNGGFNEQDFGVSLQDVDYCLRLSKEKLRTVYVAGAELFHRQSMSRQLEDDPRELAQFRKTYTGDVDPYYNPNLSKTNSYLPEPKCSLTDYRVFLRDGLQVMIFTHNLDLGGAPTAMHDLAMGLQEEPGGKFAPRVVSPVDGPLQSAYGRSGIPLQVIQIGTKNIAIGWKTKDEYEAGIQEVQALLEKEKPDVLVTNTIYGYYVIRAAQQLKTPVIWVISESFSQSELENSMNDFGLADCLNAFSEAYAVVFGSLGTRNYYERWNSQCNFHVIHNSIKDQAVDDFMEKVSQKKARAYLRAPEDKKLLLMVGTICARKGQEILVEAMTFLREKRNDLVCYLVGANEKVAGEYLEKIRKSIEKNGLEDSIKVVPETDKLYWYYRASDIFVFTSNQECYPLATLEAMAFGMPIVTTPCCGVTEQVRSVNALFFNPGDSREAAKQLNFLLDNEGKRKWMGNNSRAIFDYQQSYDEMVEKHKKLIFASWIRSGRSKCK